MDTPALMKKYLELFCDAGFGVGMLIKDDDYDHQGSDPSESIRCGFLKADVLKHIMQVAKMTNKELAASKNARVRMKAFELLSDMVGGSDLSCNAVLSMGFLDFFDPATFDDLSYTEHTNLVFCVSNICAGTMEQINMLYEHEHVLPRVVEGLYKADRKSDYEDVPDPKKKVALSAVMSGFSSVSKLHQEIMWVFSNFCEESRHPFQVMARHVDRLCKSGAMPALLDAMKRMDGKGDFAHPHFHKVISFVLLAVETGYRLVTKVCVCETVWVCMYVLCA
jgi:hypothetical protein